MAGRRRLLAGLEPPAERLEVPGRLAPELAPLPLLADRRGEAELEDRVERVVGVGQHRAQQPVQLLGGDRRERQPAVEVDVAEPVDGERDGVHPQVALEQPAVDPLVVLVRLAAHERVHAERVRADVEADGGLQLLLPRQREGEDALGALVELDPALGEVVADHLRGTAHATDSLRSARARSYTSSIRSAVCSQENCRACSSAPASSRSRRSSSSTTRRSAAAQARGSWPSTSRPLWPSRTTVVSPPTAAATTGVPVACASAATRPNDSL